MERIIQVDWAATAAINGLNAPWTDAVMLLVSRVYVWVPLYLAVVAFYFWKMPWKRALAAVLVLIAAFALTDTSTHFFKDQVFCRLRPCRDPRLADIIRPYQEMVDGIGSQCGFPSGHAANTFGFAIVTSWLSKRRWWTAGIFSWSAIISYSRIYLGKHFLGDVLCGWVYAAAVSALAILLLRWLFKKL